MSSFDVPKQFGDPQWAKDAKNQKKSKESQEVPKSVTKSDRGVFRDLEHSINASNYYAKQLKEAGKLTQEQLVAKLAKRLDLADGNVGTVLKQLRMEQQLRDKQLGVAKLANQKLQGNPEELPGYGRGLPEYHEKMREDHEEVIRAVDLEQEQEVTYQEMSPPKAKL